MGAARILSEEGHGLYRIKLEFGDQLDARIEALATKRTQLEKELLTLRAAQVDLNEIWADAYNDLRDKIEAWVDGIELPADPVMKPPQMSDKAYEYLLRTAPKIGLPDYLVAAFTRLGTAAQNKRAGEKAIADKQAEYLALLKKQTELTALKTTEAQGILAWCADYTLGMTGQVATLEVFGEYNPLIGGGVNIQPGFGGHSWNNSYGKLQRAAILSESGFAWNFTMLNPWEKWMPKWRYARVTAVVDSFSLDLELLPVVSKTGSYLSKIRTINKPWEGRMSGVPVTYMTCGAKAFKIGDEVLVQFDKSGTTYNPTVIGFKQNPAICFPDYIACNVFTALSSTQRTLEYDFIERAQYTYSQDSGFLYVMAPNLTGIYLETDHLRIITIASPSGEITVVFETRNLIEALNWYLGQGLPSIVSVTHTPSGRERTYSLDYAISSMMLVYWKLV